MKPCLLPRRPGLWLALALVLVTSGFAADWSPLPVPGTTNRAGTFWLRAWVKPHPSFFTPHERNLFEESVGLHLRNLPGAHTAYVNGRAIGSGGAFPPAYQAATNTYFRHKVPAGTLVRDQWNEIALRIHQPDGPAGLPGEAPFLMDYFNECTLEGEWEFLAGDGHSPGGTVTNRPARAAFDSFRTSHRVLGRAEAVPGPSLPPAESAARFRTADDLRLELLLHEPLIAQPFHFSFDTRGRLWVTQSRQYPYPAGVTMLSRDQYYRAHYDRVPPPPPHHDRGADRISIHEDTDGDGRYDRHRVFVDGLNLANAAVRGRDGVWVMNSPYLLFYPDRDGDDVPDGPPTVHLAGFGLEDTHSTANGLVWGPDGWLYGGQGSTTSCRVRRPGLDPLDFPGVHFEGCMVWRYHPDTRAFEIFAEGGGNTFGLEFDAQGRLYSGHNGGQTRGWHFVQGGHYLMQGVDPGKFGPPRNPYAFGELSMMATTNPVVRFTHLAAHADGTAFPPSRAGLLFALDPLHNEIVIAERQVQGSTFTTVDRGVAAKSTDEAFRPVYISGAPDGSLYVSDMYEYYIAHGQHYQNQIDRDTGRLYRLAGKDSALEKDLNVAAQSTARLLDLLDHPNKWHRQAAVRVLGERKEAATIPALRERLFSGSRHAPLHALWALHQVAGLDEATAARALRHPDPAVRQWTARLLGDQHGVSRNPALSGSGGAPKPLSAALLDVLAGQAGVEREAEVRSQFASTARRLAPAQGFRLLAALLAHREDVDDPFLPLLCWWVLESQMPVENERVMDWLRDRELWSEPLFVRQILPRVARRLAAEGRRQDLLRVAELLRRSPGPQEAGQVLKGFEEAYRGRPMTGLPTELTEALAQAGQASLAIRLRRGDPAAVPEAMELIANPSAKAEDRLQGTRLLGEMRATQAVPVLLAVATGNHPADLRRAAFAALGSFDTPDIPENTLKALPGLPIEVRSAAFALLTGRETWTRRLLQELKSGALDRSWIPLEAADRLRSHRDPAIRAAAESLLAATTGSPSAKARQTEIESVLRAGPGDPYAGETTFLQRCAGCHRLFFKGGRVGPDLTAYQRDNLGTLLPSLLDPSAEIREGYQYVTVETRDERNLAGFLVDRDAQVSVLRGLDGQDVTLTADEIRAVQQMGRSLMPEGLLDGLTPQQLRDFFAYLRISQPISR